MSILLSDIVELDLNMARSINIERDQKEISVIKEYRLTTKTIETIERFTSSLNGEKISSWSLTGPYGMGKSAFVNFLISLSGNESDKRTQLARKKLKEKNPDLFRRFVKAIHRMKNGQGFIHIPITSSYEPLNATIIRGLCDAFFNTNGNKAGIKLGSKVVKELQYLRQTSIPDTQRVLDKFLQLKNTIKRPFLIVIDEFGKNLEYMAHHPDKGDIYLIQMLAEMKDAYLWVCLHQAFEEYSSGLTTQQRLEWSKVQGRFEDVPFVESTSEMISLMRSSLIQRKNNKIHNALKDWAEHYSNRLKKLNAQAAKILTSEMIMSLYPMNPLAVLTLPELCRRFAQNDRTLFSFLYSKDQYSLSSFLNTHEISKDTDVLPELGLDYLYDYFFSVVTTAFIDRAESQRWIEIHDMVEESTFSSPLSKKILKTIGILNLIGRSHGLSATKETLRLALGNILRADQSGLDHELNLLTDRNTLIFREYANEFRLWEGSDFDIFNAIREKKATTAAKPVEQVLRDTFPLTPIIASRHSYQKGTVRQFESRWMSLQEVAQSPLIPMNGFDGLLIYCIGNERVPTELPNMCHDNKPLIVAYAPYENQIKELAMEVASIKAVLMEAPELVHDGVARKEARYRLHAAETQLHNFVNRIFSPESEEIVWYARGKKKAIKTYRDLSSLTSSLCDEIFSQSPRIGNEMINYDRLSSAAARARRELAEAIATRQQEASLGMEGFGPEVAIYKSLFLATGLHKENEKGMWYFVAPDKDSDLYMLLKKLSEMINENKNDGIKVETMVRRLKQPPFGLREGPILLYITYFLLVNADEIALFREGTYIPFIDETEISLLLKRPDIYSIKRFVTESIQREVFEAYLAILNARIMDAESGIRNPTLLSVVGPLVKFIDNLPKYSRFTRAISKEAQMIRSAIMNATDPLQLLFEDIPHAVGIDSNELLSDQYSVHLRIELQKRIKKSLIELADVYKNLSGNIEKIIKDTFRYNGDIDGLQNILKKRMKPLLSACRDLDLQQVLSATLREYENAEQWLEGLAGIIMKNPMDSWSDKDIGYFEVYMHDYADKIGHLEEMVSSGMTNDIGLKVISIMEQSGKIFRKIMKPTEEETKKAIKIVNELNGLSEGELHALLTVLAERYIIKKVNNENNEY